jgi:hypothetical protein
LHHSNSHHISYDITIAVTNPFPNSSTHGSSDTHANPLANTPTNFFSVTKSDNPGTYIRTYSTPSCFADISDYTTTCANRVYRNSNVGFGFAGCCVLDRGPIHRGISKILCSFKACGFASRD